MKNLSLIFKDTSEQHIENNLKNSDSFIIIGYAGISSPVLTSLRQSLKNVQAELLVVKNTVAQRSLKTAGYESAVNLIAGSCGMVFIKSDVAGTCKVLYDFVKQNENLRLGGGFLHDYPLNNQDIEAIAKLPTLFVLRTMVTMALKAPISSLVVVLKGNLRKVVYCLDQIRKIKGP